MRRLTLVLALGFAAALSAAVEPDPLAVPANRVSADDPAWQNLAKDLRLQKAVTADFTESRWFPFKKTPAVLKGEVRVSDEHGLSLHYLQPQDQTVVIDGRGILVRSAAGDSIPPADPRGGASNSALLDALRLDLRSLSDTFDIYGLRTGAAWTLALVPKTEAQRRTLNRISIEGEGSAVRRIELRHSALQRVEILISPPRSTAPFTPDEFRRFFRTP